MIETESTAIQMNFDKLEEYHPDYFANLVVVVLWWKIKAKIFILFKIFLVSA